MSYILTKILYIYTILYNVKSNTLSLFYIYGEIN